MLNRATGRFRTVPFHVAGIVQEFPSAPRDSFMVANLAYLTSVDQAGGPNLVFAKSSTPAATAERVTAASRSDGTVVKNIDQQAQQTVSSITTVDLRGISKIEEIFTIVLAAAAMGLFVVLAVVERRQEFATMAALGASLRLIRAFIWSEAALVVGAGLLLAIALGTLLALMLVAMLQHVFDPHPTRSRCRGATSSVWAVSQWRRPAWRWRSARSASGASRSARFSASSSSVSHPRRG